MTHRVALVVLAAMAGMPTAEAKRPPQEQAAQQDDAGMRQVQLRSYVVHTDLPDEQLEMVIPHIERMADEYAKRLSSIPGQTDNRRLPLYLYSKKDEYQKAGGRADSAGFYDGERLLALTGDKADARAWHIIQHEAFHQYLTARLGFDIPVWINEGMAEYFGESLYTGDGFVSGVVPPWRLERIQKQLKAGGYRTAAQLVTMTPAQWNEALQGENYDQAWSLVQYLAHGDGGRHQEGLLKYLRESSRGVDSLRSFQKCVGNPQEVDVAWRDYYASYPKTDCAKGYGMAAVQTFCAFVGRATVAKQKIATLDQLYELAAAGNLRQPRGDVLPAYLLLDYKEWAGQLGEYEIDVAPKTKANVTLTTADGAKVCGRIIMRAGKMQGVECWTEELGDRRRKGK